jgi:hypothetical protein
VGLGAGLPPLVGLTRDRLAQAVRSLLHNRRREGAEACPPWRPVHGRGLTTEEGRTPVVTTATYWEDGGRMVGARR